MKHIEKKISVPVCGMHCKSCEILIEDKLSELEGVKKSSANFNKGQVDVFYDSDEFDRAAVLKAIKSAGYKIGSNQSEKAFFSHDKNNYRDLGIAFLFLMAAYLILKGLGISNINLNTASSNLTLPLVLLVGLTAGVSTCMALVGGLVLGVSAKYSEAHPEANAAKKFHPHLLFNAGRIIGFTFLGGILGLFGSVFEMSTLFLGVVTVLVGLVMLIMGSQLIGIFPWADNLKLTLPKSLSRSLGINKTVKKYSNFNTSLLGALTFFLPCGFTQAMQIYAVSSGSFTRGALIMGAFALGTAPGILSVGGLASFVKGQFARRFFKFAGLAVILFAFFNISNGLGLMGLDVHGQDKATYSSTDPNVSLEDGVQVVRMTETGNGYKPNHFTIVKDVPVKWIVDAQDPYSCASVLLMKKYNVRKFLATGENVIEFTPKETGTINFSCSMGMYTGSFTVTDGKAVSKNNQPEDNNIIPVAQAASSCGMNKPSSADTSSCGGSDSCGCGGGAVAKIETNKAVAASASGDVQEINSTFTVQTDISPNTFTVKNNKPVRFTINVKEDGVGCMYQIKIPTLYEQATRLVAGETIVMEFTPTEKGQYPITCGMGMQRGLIIVE